MCMPIQATTRDLARDPAMNGRLTKPNQGDEPPSAPFNSLRLLSMSVYVSRSTCVVSDSEHPRIWWCCSHVPLSPHSV